MKTAASKSVKFFFAGKQLIQNVHTTLYHGEQIISAEKNDSL